MRTVKLVSLKLNNFKGIRDFVLDAQAANVSVFGDNATGKTTLADAFTWVLFDKDSSGRKAFEIKTLEPNGAPIHGLVHEVELALEVDGRRVTLLKRYAEEWTKKRGSAEKQFTGHTVDHFIDAVPVQANEYKSRVATIADENEFRLLTDPAYFNEQLHWQKRRETLLTICGDVSDREVINSSKALAALPEILGNRALADHRKVIVARRSEINKELERIPVRIDEATRALPEAGGNREALQADITRLRGLRAAASEQQVRLESGGEASEKKRQLTEIESGLLNVQNRLRQAAEAVVQQDRVRLAGLNDQIDAKNRELRSLQVEVANIAQESRRLDARLDTLRAEWNQTNKSEFAFSQDESCPACGQALPTERLQAARDKALAEFNLRKSDLLAANVIEGKRTKAEADKVSGDALQRQTTIAQAEQSLRELEEAARQAHLKIEQLRQGAPDGTKDPEYMRLQEQRAQIEAELTDLRFGNNEALQKVARSLADIDGQIRTLDQGVARIDQRETGLARIAELSEQERQLATEFERLEKELYLTEEFIRVKVGLLTDKINGRFEHAHFKLFNTQVNGGVEECCETLYKGVPYSTALNNGARINVGLDIINTLSAHFGFLAPIWVDNAEAVTRLIPVKAQVISLVVSESDKQLRVQPSGSRQLQLEAV